MSTLDPADAVCTLTGADLVRRPGAITADLAIEANTALESVTLTYDRPWLPPSNAESRISDIVRAKSGGISELYEAIAGESIEIAAPFAASVTDASRAALVGRWGGMLTLHSGTVGTLALDVLPEFEGDVGDIVLATFAALPNSSGTGPMADAVCRVLDRQHVSRPIGDASDTITVAVYGWTSEEIAPRAWAPSGLVASVVSATNFDLSGAYSNPDIYASDAVSFVSGMRVHIYTASWVLRTDTPGVVASGIGNTITLSVAAKLGAATITPNVGDKIALSTEGDQPVSTPWQWQTVTAPGYPWL
jgi:hypothetical protein